MISADRVWTSRGGEIEYSGNVVMKLIAPKGPEVIWEAETVNLKDDGSTLLEGAVRFSFAGGVLTTDRATLLNDGTIRMDSGRYSQTSKSR